MRKIVILLCLFWMGFIFHMSSNNGEISHQQSNKIVNLIENKTKNKDSEANKNIIKEQQVKEKRLDYLVRKNAHAFMYMILALLVSSVFFVYNKRGKNTIVYILFICLFYAVTDEFHQSFVPERTSVVSDVLVDFGGALIGLIFFYLAYYKIYERYVIKKRKNESIKI
ncbi:VanZ like family protein [Clostridium puniceum]|uniref:VanZ like family protein n=1 Tax=Clostridium puniceum TaxID=29367 RepID=A0A1S8TUW4_9CLOT|nr:VanZ family protein [Clostridium puniceum]OOM81520.1 VanZ like family protein [Clostridium puniceum]